MGSSGQLLELKSSNKGKSANRQLVRQDTQTQRDSHKCWWGEQQTNRNLRLSRFLSEQVPVHGKNWRSNRRHKYNRIKTVYAIPQKSKLLKNNAGFILFNPGPCTLTQAFEKLRSRQSSLLYVFQLLYAVGSLDVLCYYCVLVYHLPCFNLHYFYISLVDSFSL